jgi:hypothetical protein
VFLSRDSARESLRLHYSSQDRDRTSEQTATRPPSPGGIGRRNRMYKPRAVKACVFALCRCALLPGMSLNVEDACDNVTCVVPSNFKN